LLAVILLSGGCAADPPLPPASEAEARAHLASIVEIVAGGDLSGICDLGSATCPGELRESDPALVPVLPPVVVGSEAIQPRRRGDGLWDSGGLLLRLCGLDGTGKRYASEILVFRREPGEDLISINTLYWLGARIAREPTVPAGPPPQACAS
jgi:hypothetical protein